MELFHMRDILPLIGISYPSDGRRSFYTACPCCDETARNRHLNINLAKDVFRCPRCGVSGGLFDLYSLYTGIPRDKARRAIAERIGSGKGTEPLQVSMPVATESVSECPMTDTETRHATYSALLERLSLAADHMENLRGRGLTEEEIRRYGYRTTPIIGTAVLAKHLQTDGFYLRGVPGFYRTEDGSWSFVHEERGILIPVRDADGAIQGLQIRRDKTEKRKFRWVSSAEREDGCSAEGWTHLSGAVSEDLILTEGPMKADVIHALTGKTVLAVPGVNSLTKLKQTLDILRERGLQTVRTAFDMDFITNPHVQAGMDRLFALLDGMDFHYGTYVWDPQYKGLDDYIWESCLMRKR